jgi:ubiquinone/menaquinone biosynthesis C-methylase UbiE
MSGLEASRKFWDEKARENPYWYVSSAGPYEGRNLAEFWASGSKIWNDLKSASGYAPKRTDAVVEIGCGVGRLTRAIAPEVGQVFAFDLSAEMLTIARKSVEAANASFQQAKTPALAEIADNSIDAFVAYCVFQHLPDLEVLREYLKTAARVLKPGGTLVFSMTPRTWRDSIALALRARRWLVERRAAQGPRGLYRNEWYGIRPTIQEIGDLCPIKTKNILLHGDKWLLFGTR